jgi:hypothetical protein
MWAWHGMAPVGGYGLANTSESSLEQRLRTTAKMSIHRMQTRSSEGFRAGPCPIAWSGTRSAHLKLGVCATDAALEMRLPVSRGTDGGMSNERAVAGSLGCGRIVGDAGGLPGPNDGVANCRAAMTGVSVRYRQAPLLRRMSLPRRQVRGDEVAEKKGCSRAKLRAIFGRVP